MAEGWGPDPQDYTPTVWGKRFPFKGVQSFRKVFNSQTVQGRTNDRNLSCKLNAIFPTRSFHERCHQLREQQPNCSELLSLHTGHDAPASNLAFRTQGTRSDSKQKVLYPVKNLTELTLLSTHMQNKGHFLKWDGPLQKISPESLGVKHLYL